MWTRRIWIIILFFSHMCFYVGLYNIDWDEIPIFHLGWYYVQSCYLKLRTQLILWTICTGASSIRINCIHDDPPLYQLGECLEILWLYCYNFIHGAPHFKIFKPSIKILGAVVQLIFHDTQPPLQRADSEIFLRGSLCKNNLGRERYVKMN